MTFEWLLKDFWETFERLLRDFWETFKSWIATSEKRGPSCPNWGHGGGGKVIRAMPERKRFFSIDPFPYSVLNLSQPTKSWAISTILEAAPCTTVGAKVLKCLSLCPATIGRMKNNWGNGDKPLCISYLSFHAREAAHPFAFYHFRPNSLTLIVFDLTLWHHGEAAPA